MMGAGVKFFNHMGRTLAVINRAFDAAGLQRGRVTVAPFARPFQAAVPPNPAAAGAVFASHEHTSAHGALAYKLYVPSPRPMPAPEAMPLVVMLHGCKQNPDDFAAGTRMNQFGEAHGFLVAYPEQSARANGSRCWNWFDASQQVRSGTEPSLIAGVVADIARLHAVDAQQVFVAGLSAGGAMAAILLRTHPDVFAAGAVHSGLPLGAAHDVPSAFAAMQGRPPFAPPHAPPFAPSFDETVGVPSDALRPAPVIVFHGDADRTVVASNGAAVVAAAVAAEEDPHALLRTSTQTAGQRGKPSTVTHHARPGGAVVAEHWLVHGGPHAWFGGSNAGSFTDADGPDASAEIVRFFLQR
jgi:poly(hydroxyalkanoate) depolymerase family esterase